MKRLSGLFAPAAIVLVTMGVFAQPVEWIQLQPSPPVPPAQVSHTMVYDVARSVTVLHAYGETWEWDGAAWSFRSVSGPSPRRRHAMAYDPLRGVSVLFGGQLTNGDQYDAETWEWDGETWVNRTTADGPSPRSYAAMVFDASRGVVALIGGYGTVAGPPFYRTFREHWEWNGSAWTQRVLGSSPPGRFRHTMAYDTNRDVLVLYGGSESNAISTWRSDVWELRGDTWSRVRESSDGPRVYSQMTFDAGRQVVFQFGGADAMLAYDTARDWDGLDWTTWGIQGPLPRSSHAMAYDSTRGEVVLFGGMGNGEIYGDTWVLRRSCAPYFTRHPTGGALCTGNLLSLSIEAAGGDSREYQWRKDDQALADIPGRIAGAQTPTLVVLELSIDDAGAYDCVVTNSCDSVASNKAMVDVRANPGDVDCDADVDLGDLAGLLSNFGRTGGAPPRGEGDLDRDGDVDLEDLNLLLGAFGAAY